jgi:hypothetical protein
MVSPNLRSAANAETRPAKRKSHEFSDTDVTPESESESEGVSEYEDGHSSLRPRRKTAATSIAAKVVKRRRAAAGRSKLMAQQRVSPAKAVTPPPTTASTSTSPEEFEGSEGKDSEEGHEDEDSGSANSEPTLVLKWRDIPYPGLPVGGILHLAFLLDSPSQCDADVRSIATRICLFLRLRADLLPQSPSFRFQVLVGSLASSSELRRLRHLFSPSLIIRGQQTARPGDGE